MLLALTMFENGEGHGRCHQGFSEGLPDYRYANPASRRTASSYHDNLKAILFGRQFDGEDAVSTRQQFHGSPRRESVSRRRDLLR